MKNIKILIGILGYIFENEEKKFLIPFRISIVFIWQLWKRTISLPIILRLGNGQKYYAVPEAGNSTGAIYVSTYEKRYIKFLRKNFFKKTSTWIDVGGNTGLFAMWFSDIFDKGFVFEPTPDLYNILKTNIQINNLSKYKAFNMACSDNKKELELIITGKFSGDNRILNDIGIRENEYILKVDSIPIDDLNLVNGIDFLKIDTEGSELSILKGAFTTLEKSRHAIVLVENNDFVSIMNYFSKLGWRGFDIDSAGKITQEKEKLKKAYNLIFVGPDHPLFKLVIN